MILEQQMKALLSQLGAIKEASFINGGKDGLSKKKGVKLQNLFFRK